MDACMLFFGQRVNSTCTRNTEASIAGGHRLL
jgi:hypothetical protein